MAEPGFERTELCPRIAEKLFDIQDDLSDSRAKVSKSV